jgi:ComF family protein
MTCTMHASTWFDRLLPRVCLDCELHTRAPFDLCEHCTAALPWNVPACSRCALPLPVTDATCPACERAAPPFAAAFVPLLYEPPVGGWVHAAKFSASPVHLGLLTTLFASATVAQARFVCAPLPQALVPVPLSRRRLLRRGHNPALLIADRIGLRLGIPVMAGLVRRIRHTRPQQGLGRRARLTNLAGAFAATGQPPPHLAIVDDVLTTGTTAAELTRTLLAAGAERVQVWALARATADL